MAFDPLISFWNDPWRFYVLRSPNSCSRPLSLIWHWFPEEVFIVQANN